MNRSEVVAITAAKTGIPTDAVEKVLTVSFDLITDTLTAGDSVNIRRFGKFEPRLRRAMVKSNPRTGEPMQIPERLGVVFLPSEILKATLNGEDPEDVN